MSKLCGDPSNQVCHVWKYCAVNISNNSNKNVTLTRL